MLRIGLTGGTGAGKSTVAQLLGGQGAVLIDADVLAREVLAPGSAGLAAVVAEFGPGVLAPDGALDRPALAAAAFASDDRRRVLEGITHPRIAARTRELFAAAPADAVVVHDVPLLVEKGMGPAYHLVVVVDADVETRVARLGARGMAEGDARSRIRAQATREQRLAAADVWLENQGAQPALARAVERLWLERLLPYEQNVRQRTAVPKPTAAVPSDPSWPAQAARLLARLRLVAGERAVDARHVGPTSEPGQPAADVLDLELGLRSAPDAGVLADPLADAGFPPDGEPPAGCLACCGSADPGRPARLLLREQAP